MPTFNANPEGGVYISTSSVAVRDQSPSMMMGLICPGNSAQRELYGVFGHQSRRSALDAVSGDNSGTQGPRQCCSSRPSPDGMGNAIPLIVQPRIMLTQVRGTNMIRKE